MNIVIFGASGKTGKLLVNQTLEAGHIVTAYLRRESSLEIKHPNLKIIIGNLNDKEKIKEALESGEACISTLGGSSLTKHSTEIINGIDLIVSLMEEKGIKRFIYLSSVGAGESRYYIPQPFRFIINDILLRVPLFDHNKNEQRLRNSNLQWTFIRPGSLTDGEKTGHFVHGSEKAIFKGNLKISRADVASLIIEQLNDNKYINKGVWIHA